LTAAVQPKPRARYAAKREAILAAATKVFAEAGMTGFTLAAVAKRMDLHPVSLTYYFKRKEDLAAAVLQETIRRFAQMLDHAEAQGAPAERLRAFVRSYFETRRQIAVGEETPLAPFSEVYLVEGEQKKPVIQSFEALYVRIGRLLKSDDTPWVGAPRRRGLARLIVNQLTWSDTWLPSYEPQDYGRVADRLSDIMIFGLAAEGQAWPDLPLIALGAQDAENEEVTRERFLVAATKLINREGYHGASVDKISAELKVTKGSFYHHNSDKDELAVACFNRTFDLIDQAKAEAAKVSPGWPRLWLAISSLGMHQAETGGGGLLRHHAMAAIPQEMRRQMRGRFQQITHAFAGVISDGVADGSIRAIDPLLAAHAMMVTFNACLQLEPGRNPPDIDGVIEEYLRPALLGFFVE
jgi:AcrR family transcriptional regulator